MVTRIISESDEVDDAVQRVRDTFSEVVDEVEDLSDQARESVEEAIDELETRIEFLRKDK